MMLRNAEPDVEIAPPLRLVEEINHRVVNEYAEAIASLSLAARSACPMAREVLAMAASRLRAHAETHRALLPPSVEGEVNLTDYIAGVCASLSRASLADNGTQITLKADDVWLDLRRRWLQSLTSAPGELVHWGGVQYGPRFLCEHHAISFPR